MARDDDLHGPVGDPVPDAFGPRGRALAVQRRSRGMSARRQMQNNFSPHQ
jgi:hypothetical protein